MLFTTFATGKLLAVETATNGDIGDALGQPGWTWETGGEGDWFVQSEVTYDGEPAMQSGEIEEGEISWLQTTVDGPGVLTFAWRASSAWHFNLLRFTVDGAFEHRISGETEWEDRTVELDPGPNTLRWAYSKDGDLSYGEDASWLADVRWEPASDYVRVFPMARRLGAAAHEYAVTVESDTEWNVDEKPDWVSVDPESGSGDSVITVAASSNPGIIPRRGTIIIGDATHDIAQGIRAGQRFAVGDFEPLSDDGAILEFLAEPGMRYFAQVMPDLEAWEPGEFRVEESSFSDFFVHDAQTVELEVHPAGDEPAGDTTRAFWRVRGEGPPRDYPLVPAGAFAMGDHHAEDELWMADSRPVHRIETDSFYISPAPVTYGEWREVYDWAIQNGYDFDSPGQRGSGTDWEGLQESPENDQHPVVNISWYDAVKWCNAKSEMSGGVPAYYTDTEHAAVYRTGHHELAPSHVRWNASGYRLPMEAEWEKAARGGLEAKRWPWGDQAIDETRANYTKNNGDGGTTRVASYPPNDYGIYDTAGNVWEWTWDWHDENWYRELAGEISLAAGGPAEGFGRVVRGGSWDSISRYCRVSHRLGIRPDVRSSLHGFRVVFGDARTERASIPVHPHFRPGDVPEEPDGEPDEEPPSLPEP